MIKQNIVAIVGRPNVGKSTLFNRLLEKRSAIVDSISGVTRDRNYGDAEWAGTTFSLIDTGGFVPNSKDLFETAIREQVQIAIDEADFVIFVVDGLTGPIPIDQDIAEIIRKSNKTAFLIVNKIDNNERESLASSFYSLGIGEPTPISALAGRNLGDFLDRLVEKMSKSETLNNEDKIKLAVIGKPNVGKSSFVNALLGFERNIVTPLPGTTRDSINSLLKYNNEEYIIIDTAGLRKKSKIKENLEFFSILRTLKSLQQCDIAIVIVDATQGLEHQDKKIINDAVKLKKGIVLVINKWDLIEKDSNTAKEMEKTIKEEVKTLDYIPVIFTSAITKQRVYKTIDLAKSVYIEKNKKIKTNELNKILLDEIERTPPSSSSGKEVKINYISQIKVNPPVIVFFTNNPKLIQESYIRFLERKIRQNFGFIGTPLTLQFRRK